ncbi:MAG: metal ABC transporter permease [Clostridia bacterium]|nr:metal ABC transporter permease [Clostridia bacterium]
MLDFFSEMFSYSFMQRAVIAGVLVALCSALLGVTLVLKRYSMIGDGLSHVGFGAACIAMALNVTPLKIAVPVVVIAAFLLMRINSSAKIKGDAAIALISSSAIAVGVIAASLTTGLNSDVSGYMFGSILMMSDTNVVTSVVLSCVVLVLYIVFYNRIFSVTFDESFAAATGTKTGIYNTLIALLTAVTVVVGMRMMGALLISSLIIFPALSSMRICKSFKSVTVVCAIVSVLCFFIGISASYALNTPAGASVVVANAVCLILFSATGAVLRRVRK